jgi:hypothetical protein
MYKKMGYIGLVSVMLAGCSHATYYAQRVPTQTYMSQNISLSEVPVSAKTVHVNFKNNSSLSSSYIFNKVLANLKNKGYRLENNPVYAHYVMYVDLEKVLYVSEGVALDIGRSPYKTPLDTVPLYGDGKNGYYAGVADIKLIVKNAYAKNGRNVYKSRLVAFPDQPNLKAYYSKPAIAYAMAQKIDGFFPGA